MGNEYRFPKSLHFFEDWYKTFYDNLYYADLQRSASSNNSSAFSSLKVIPKKKFDFNLLNTDLYISLNKNLENRENKIEMNHDGDLPFLKYPLFF